MPEIRFPEFMNDGEWLSAPLNELIKAITPPRKLQTSEYKPLGKYPIIDQSQKYIVAYSDAEEALTNTGCSDTIVFGDHTCALKFVNFPFIQGADGIKIFRSKDSNKILTDYLYQYLSAFPIESKEYKRHFSELKETVIKFPSDVFEQKKIAECMKSLERYTIQTKVKLEQLKAHKKGLMQKLFPQADASIPNLRFPGFSDEWEKMKLGSSFIERSEKNRGDLPLLSLGEAGLVLQRDTERKDNSNADKSKYLRVAKGDIAYNTMRMWQGRCAYANIEGIVSPAYTVCIPKSRIDGIFHYYLFKTDRMICEFQQNSQGLVSDTLNLKYESFAKIKYFLPPTLAEQKKIAECLSSIDDTIRLYSNKLDILEQHKQALRQRLFPTI